MQDFIETIENLEVKRYLLKCLSNGDNLKLIPRGSSCVSGQYVTCYGGYTVVRK